MSEVLIIGAGCGGLYLGHLLRQKGVDYEIIEASERVGGRVVTMEKNGDKFDVGAQVYHSNYKTCESLIKSLQLERDRVPVRGTTLYSSSSGATWEQDKSPWIKGLGVLGNLSLLEYILKEIVLSERPPLYRIDKASRNDLVSVEEYFKTKKNSEFGDYFIPLLCAAMNVSTPELTSMQHLQHIFRISAFSSMYTFKNGNHYLWQKLSEHQPVRFKSPVERLVQKNGKVVGVKIRDQEEILYADQIVLATPPSITKELLSDYSSRSSSFFMDLPAARQTIPVLLFDRKIDPSVVNYIGDSRNDLSHLMAIDCSNKAPELVQSGKSCLTLWDYYPKSLELESASDDEVRYASIRSAMKLVPGLSEQWIQDIELVKHSYSHLPYSPGMYEKISKFTNGEESTNRVHIVSDLFGGSYMECSLIRANTIYERVMNNINRRKEDES